MGGHDVTSRRLVAAFKADGGLDQKALTERGPKATLDQPLFLCTTSSEYALRSSHSWLSLTLFIWVEPTTRHERHRSSSELHEEEAP